MKTAIIGCGVVAKSHLRILARLYPGNRICLCDSDEERVSQLATEAAADSWFTDFDRLLESERPDAVHIVTPPSTHFALAEKALSSGCSVFLEKPATETEQECTKLFELAEKCGKTLCCDYSTLGMPVVEKAINEIRSGLYGRLVAVHCNFAGSEGRQRIPYADPAHWAYRLPGGVLQNMADHPASLLIAAMDSVSSWDVRFLQRNLLPFDCSDLMHVSLFNEDQAGSFTLSLGHGCNERRAQFLLEGGTISIDLGRQLYSSIKSRGPQPFVKKAATGISEAWFLSSGTLKNAVLGLSGRLQRDPGIARLMDNFYKVLLNEEEPLISRDRVIQLTRLFDGVWQAKGVGPLDSVKTRGLSIMTGSEEGSVFQIRPRAVVGG